MEISRDTFNNALSDGSVAAGEILSQLTDLISNDQIVVVREPGGAFSRLEIDSEGKFITTQIDTEGVFDQSNSVRFNEVRSDGTSEITCNQCYARSIIEALKAATIVSGLDPEAPAVGDYAVIITSTMAKPQAVKEALREWMLNNHVGNIDTTF